MSLKTLGSVRFYDYSVDRLRWVIQWQEEPIPLSRKTFDLLVYLIDHRDRVVSKDELLSKLWPDQFIEESNLTQHVFLLRKALSKQGASQKVIDTVPGRGYRFSAPLVETDEPDEQMVFKATESITRITLEEEDEEEDPATATSVVKLPSAASATPHRLRLVLISAGVLIALAAGGWFGWQRWLDRSGGSPVQVVLVPLEGTTGDPVLDKSLTQALRMDLAQSPYVSVIGSGTFAATLTQMKRKPDDAMTSAVAREICERTNSQSFLSGSIAKVGNHFLISEEATNCVDGLFLGAAKEEAMKPEDLPHAIDKLAASLRQKLGESRRSIARFNTPLFPNNTASLDALKAFTLGTQAIREGRLTEAITLLKTAVADDPQFAAAYSNLAAAYGTVGDDLHLREAVAKAYSLKDTAPRQTQFAIQTMYDSEYTGDMWELVRSYQSWVALYPNSSQAWSGLANAQGSLGLKAEALASQRRVVELLPNSQGMLANLALYQMENNDPKAAVATCERAIHNGLDGDGLRVRYLQVAYLLKDPEMLRAQRVWEAAHPEALVVLGQETSIAMAEGRFADARALIEHIHDLQKQQGLGGADDERVKFAAVDLMQAGDLEAGKKIFQSSPVDIEEGQEVLGLAYAGDFPAAQAAVRAGEAKYPKATMWKVFWGPRIGAKIALAQHRPGEAAALLETARPLQQIGFSIPWLRGNAYLADGKPALAEQNFRSVLDHPEIDPTSPYISLSWLGLGEAFTAEGNRAGAIAAYQHFFALWSHADSDAAYLKRAKSEYEELQPTAARIAM